MLRGCAVLMAAYYALALSRGLIPGLCATQAALGTPDAKLQIASGCCSHDSNTAPGAGSDQTHCAFCTLATTVAQTVESPVLSPTQSVERPFRIDGQSAPELAVAHDPIQRRGPPALV